nr:MAG TPA: hypothetical protein [Caudoviricetes sp.]
MQNYHLLDLSILILVLLQAYYYSSLIQINLSN